MIYYYDLFWGIPVKNLFRQPSFWIVSGIFLCLTVTVPLGVIKTLLISKNDLGINLIATYIAIFFYGIMHLFFIKAYLCSTNPSKI
jgi:hypothetical protein